MESLWSCCCCLAWVVDLLDTKVKIEMRLRRETVMTWHWIAQRRHMGCGHTLANCSKAALLTNSLD